MERERAAAIWDEATLSLTCRRCGPLPPRVVVMVDGVPYANLDALRSHVRRLASRWLVEEPAERCHCGQLTQVTELSYAVAHAELGRVILHATRGLLGMTLKVPVLDARGLEVLRRDALLRRCHLLIARGQAGLARPAIAAATRELRGDSELLKLAGVLLDADEVESALRISEGHVSVHTDDPQGLSLLGRVTLAAIRLGILPATMRLRAELHLGEALARCPADVEAARALARAQAGRGKLFAARATLERALEADPDALELRVELGTLDTYHSDEPAELLASLDQALKTDPHDPQLLDLRVRTLVRVGRYTEAQAVVAQLNVASPRHPTLRELTGLVARALVAAPTHREPGSPPRT